VRLRGHAIYGSPADDVEVDPGGWKCCMSASGMFRPTHLPMAPIHINKYSWAVVSLLPRLASITSVVWHGWMKNTGRFDVGWSWCYLVSSV
jgi:hypothetical protein